MNPANNYSRLSIWTHWITAVSVIALFLSHQGEGGGVVFTFHVIGGAYLGIFLLWRVAYRLIRGATTKPEQALLLNLLSSIVIYGLLVAIVILVLTGYLLPWSLGNPIEFYFFNLPAPIAESQGMYERLQRAHDIAGHLIVPLTALHFLGALKHLLINRDGVAQRMFKSTDSGK